MPGLTIPSIGVAVTAADPDALRARLRDREVIARVDEGVLVCDLRTVEPEDDVAAGGGAPRVMRVVATAGHVDHGKSTLVLALTGTDPDRFAEEKARGLTIDLGFAFTTLASGTEVGFVDVPGHVRFLKNMLAGVGAVDMVLFVVSAREGWMPQSEEHLVILELLGVRHGVVALTNCDTIDAKTLAAARLAVIDRFARSSFHDVPVVVCDSVSGRGLDDVRAALDAVLQSAPPAADLDRPRLWIDRVFAARGAGTVVTGTLVGGSVAVGDTLEVGGTGTRVRVRGIETAHRRAEHAAPATRVALNLTGVERSALGRGRAREARPVDRDDDRRCRRHAGTR